MRLNAFRLAVILFCIPFAANAHEASDELLELLYKKSGLQVQMDSLPASMRQMFDQKLAADPELKNLGHEALSALRNGLQAVFAPEPMKTIIIQEIRKGLSGDDVRAALVWLDSPIGRKITKLEEYSSTPAFAENLPRFIENLQNQPPDRARLNAVIRLEKAIKATDSMVEVVMTSTLATLVAFSAILPDGQQKSLSDLSTELGKSRPQLHRMMEQQVRVNFLYTYQRLENSEIDFYAEFAESGTGRKYHNAIVAGFVKALLNSISNFPGEIEKELKDHRT